jgi:hypothetical protein
MSEQAVLRIWLRISLDWEAIARRDKWLSDVQRGAHPVQSNHHDLDKLLPGMSVEPKVHLAQETFNCDGSIGGVKCSAKQKLEALPVNGDSHPSL